MSAGRIAARTKPVVIVKAGRSSSGARAATSHTGALAGSDIVYDAAFRRAGILRVDTLRDLFDAAETLASGWRPRGDRLLIITNGGGLGVLAADALEQEGGRLAVLSAASIAKLSAACLRPGRMRTRWILSATHPAPAMKQRSMLSRTIPVGHLARDELPHRRRRQHTGSGSYSARAHRQAGAAMARLLDGGGHRKSSQTAALAVQATQLRDAARSDQRLHAAGRTRAKPSLCFRRRWRMSCGLRRVRKKFARFSSSCSTKVGAHSLSWKPKKCWRAMVSPWLPPEWPPRRKTQGILAKEIGGRVVLKNPVASDHAQV